MTLHDDLTTAQRVALKDRAHAAPEDQNAANTRLMTIRAALGAIGEAATAGKERHELTHDEQVAVVKKEVAKREQSAAIYDGAGEDARALQERAEAAVLREFLPAETNEDDLRAAVERIVAEKQLAGQGGRAIGAVMAELKNEFENFDSRAAAKIIQAAV